MKITKLIIKNFRSIDAEGIEIIFDTNLTALIGKNNVGKSNILAAIDIILGGYWPTENRFQIDDFHKKKYYLIDAICCSWSKKQRDQEGDHTIQISKKVLKKCIKNLLLGCNRNS